MSLNRTYPSDCLQQRTSRLKGDAERYRHFMKKNKMLQSRKNDLSKSLQKLYSTLQELGSDPSKNWVSCMQKS